MKLEINNRKFTNMWKLNNKLLDSQWVEEEIIRQIRMYLKTNENENTKYQTYGMQ